MIIKRDGIGKPYDNVLIRFTLDHKNLVAFYGCYGGVSIYPISAIAFVGEFR